MSIKHETQKILKDAETIRKIRLSIEEEENTMPDYHARLQSVINGDDPLSQDLRDYLIEQLLEKYSIDLFELSEEDLMCEANDKGII